MIPHPGLTVSERVNVASRLFRFCGSVERAMELTDALEAEAPKRVPPPFVPADPTATDPLAPTPIADDWPGGKL